MNQIKAIQSKQLEKRMQGGYVGFNFTYDVYDSFAEAKSACINRANEKITQLENEIRRIKRSIPQIEKMKTPDTEEVN